MTSIKSSIILQQLELSLHLGWTEAERLHAQSVQVDIHIHFAKPPRACTTDELKDTYCYHTLCNQIQEHITPRPFRLVEQLGYEIYRIAKNFLPDDAYVNICVTKKPVILNLKGGVSFWYGDFEEKPPPQLC